MVLHLPNPIMIGVMGTLDNISSDNAVVSWNNKLTITNTITVVYPFWHIYATNH